MRWPLRKLDELGEVARGRSRHRPRDAAHLYGGQYPFVQTGDVKHANLYLRDYSQTYSEAGLAQSRLWSPGTLCITIAANIADTAILDIEACFPDSVIGFLADESKADVRFVKYMFDAMLKKRFKQFAQGAAQDNLSQEKLLSIDFPVPADVREQRRIADILSTYDDLIENNRRRIQLLEQAARLLYKEWFVHLRFPGHEHVKITDGVPEGWEQTTLGEIIESGEVELQTGPFGTQLKASEYVEDGTPVINVRNIGYGEIRDEKLEYIPEAKVSVLTKHVLHTGDIVFGRKGAVDRHVLITSAQNGWVQGSDCIRMRVGECRVSAEYLSVGFREEQHRQWMLNQCGNKATMASLNQDVIARIPVQIPSHECLLLFDDFAKRMLTQIATLQSQIERLCKARDLLLPRLMNGEIPV
jgi:type I restriction enzyme S subunit